ncbi:protein kinase domain-containing protein [Gracilimonas sp. Q87]|uniref:protein kinase domain-containing protein n=1 Tax=Gracilimonas sp. Q87 TaxID=3384766 RepID=UPI0039840282
MIGKQILHYQVLQKLGEGGMGKVYLAEDTRLNRKVALKFLASGVTSDDSQVKQFRNEARIAASLSHPNIAQVYAIEDCEEGSFIAMQYIDGEDLDTFLTKDEVTIKQKEEIALKVAEGIWAAHNKDIIHRDIKAGNIMVTNEGQVKVLDFGLAQLASVSKPASTGVRIGTAPYMAPELILGRDADIRSEVWAYGVVLYQLFTGQLPFDGAYDQAITYSILDEEPQAAHRVAADIPSYIELIIDKCLQKKPENRYQSFQDIISDIKEYTHAAFTKTGNPPTLVNIITSKKIALFSVLALLIIIPLGFIIYQMSNPFDGKIRKLAIIPFKNVNDNNINRVLLDGVLETMTSKLSQIDNYKEVLWVIPSSEVINNNVSTAQEAYKFFGVNLAVTGSFQDLDEIKRLTINLIDAKNLRQLKSSVIDISGDNILNLQTETVLKLIEMLDIQADDQIKGTLNQGITNDPEASSYYISGQGYLHRYLQEDYLNNAIMLFNKAIEEDPDYALAYAALGESYWRKYEILNVVTYVDSARIFLNKAMEINSELTPVKQTIGLLDLGTGDYEKAIDVFTSILEQEPGNEVAYGGLAEAYDNLGMYEEAEKTYKKAIDLKPGFWLSYKRLGNFYLRKGEYEKALKPLYEVVQLTPDNHDGYSNIGVIYYYMANWEMAKKYFTESYEMEPTYSAASNLGTVNYIESNYEEAAKYYSLALAINPNDYQIWGNLASLQGLLGAKEDERANYLKAIEVAEKQLEINPNNINLISVLGSYYSDVGDSLQAVIYLERSLKLAPELPDLIFRAGSAYENLGNRERAIELMTQALLRDYPLENILIQPELSSLVADSRFQEVINTYRTTD